MQSWQRTYIYFTFLFIVGFIIPKLSPFFNENSSQVQNESISTTENVEVFSSAEAEYRSKDEDTLVNQKVLTKFSSKTTISIDTLSNEINSNPTEPAQKKYIRRKPKKQENISRNEDKASKELQMEVIGEQQIIEGNKYGRCTVKKCFDINCNPKHISCPSLLNIFTINALSICMYLDSKHAWI